MMCSSKMQLTLLLVLAFYCSNSFAEINRSCFNLDWKRGKPFDYYAQETRERMTGSPGGLLAFVEKYHFTQNVQQLAKGESGSLLGDLLFVLNSIPNHPKALDAYSRYVNEYHGDSTSSRGVAPHDADCFFARATEVFPGRAETRVVWAIHHHRNGAFQEARSELKKALQIAPNYPEAHYNLGLVELALGNLKEAKRQANLAYQGGYPLVGLKNKIERLETQQRTGQ